MCSVAAWTLWATVCGFGKRKKSGTPYFQKITGADLPLDPEKNVRRRCYTSVIEGTRYGTLHLVSNWK